MTATPSHPHAAMTHPHPSDPNPPDPGAPAAPEPGSAPAQHLAASAEPATSRTGRAAGRLRAAAADNLMVAIFGPIIVLLLSYSLYTTNDRFDDISNDFAAVNDRFTAVDARFTAVDDRFTALEASIDRRFAAIDDRFTALEASIDRRFAAVDDRFTALEAKIAALEARIDELDAKFDEINLKLTVLIAALNKTDEVEAAIAGEVTATVSSAASIPPP